MAAKKMTTESIKSLFNTIASRYDLVNKIISFGQDASWRTALVASCASPKNGQGVLCDIATGTGEVLFAAVLARKDYTAFKGYDISGNMLKIAEQKLTSKPELLTKKKNITFVEAMAHALPAESGAANAVTVAYGVRNFIERKESLQEFYRILAPRGTLSILEILPPANRIKKKIFNLYFARIMPTLASILSRKDAYRYLSNSVNNTLTAPELINELTNLNFRLRSHKSWIFGAVNLIVVEKPC